MYFTQNIKVKLMSIGNQVRKNPGMNRQTFERYEGDKYVNSWFVIS